MKIQKVYKRVKLKRVVRRALLNLKWENYIEMDLRRATLEQIRMKKMKERKLSKKKTISLEK